MLHLASSSTAVAALLAAALLGLPAAAQDSLMDAPEAARPGPTSEAANGEPAGIGSTITRSLRPGDEVAGPPFGVGVSERATVAQSADRLREAQAAVAALKQRVEGARPHPDLTGTDLGADAQRIIDMAQYAVQSLQHSRAVPTSDQDVRSALTTITDIQHAMLSDAGQAAPLLDRLADQLSALMFTAQQAMDTPPADGTTAGVPAVGPATPPRED